MTLLSPDFVHYNVSVRQSEGPPWRRAAVPKVRVRVRADLVSMAALRYGGP